VRSGLDVVPALEPGDGGFTVKAGLFAFERKQESHGLANRGAGLKPEEIHDGLAVEQRALGGLAVGFGQLGDATFQLVDVMMKLDAFSVVPCRAVATDQHVK
jgi:hypothetical protein